MIENVIITKRKIFISVKTDDRYCEIEKVINRYLPELKKIQDELKER